ncbi:MAG: tetratricopeptide repeat protein [Candidatus Latescibacterota bacterium]
MTPARSGHALAGAAALVLLVAAVFANSLDNGFHYDDTHSILDNHQLRRLANLPRFYADPGTFSREPGMAMYRPLLVTTFALNYAAGGYAPEGYHLVNLALHAACAVAVFALLRGLTGAGAAWACAALFAVHPVQTQVVNYISSRSEVLAALGVLVAYQLSGRPGRRPLAVACYAAALLGKETAVALPLLLLARQGVRRRPAGWWRAHLPFWGVTLAYLVLITANHFLTRSLTQDVRPYGQHLLTQAKALAYYAQLVAMPVQLSVEHPLGLAGGPLQATVLASLALAGSVAWLAWRGGAVAGLGVGWIGAGLAVCTLVPLNVVVNEHRLYLPLVGLLVVLAAALRPGRTGLPLSAAAAGCLALFTVLSWQRNYAWRDDLSLWGGAVARAPGSFRAQSNWGLALYEAGRLPEARGALERSLALEPAQAKAWNTLGLVHDAEGDGAAARAAFSRALGLRPELAGTRVNLARLSLVEGRPEEARALLVQALQDDPACAPAHVTLGLLLQRQGALEAAIGEYEAALAVEPGSAAGRTNLALALEETGQGERALAELRRVVAQDPAYVEGRINLAMLEARARGQPARHAWEELAQAFPGRPEVWMGLAAACAAQGEVADAARACGRAEELRPGDARLAANCARLRQAAGQ